MAFGKLWFNRSLLPTIFFGYVNDTIPCPTQTLPADDKATSADPTPKPSYIAWLANNAHVCMLLLSTISEASYAYAQGTRTKDIWLSLQRAYAP